MAFYHKSVFISIHIVFYVIFHAFHKVIQWAYIQTSLSMLVVYLLIVGHLPYSRSTAKLFTSLYCFNVIDVLFNILYIYIISESPCRSSLNTIVISSILLVHIRTTLPVTCIVVMRKLTTYWPSYLSEISCIDPRPKLISHWPNYRHYGSCFYPRPNSISHSPGYRSEIRCIGPRSKLISYWPRYRSEVSCIDLGPVTWPIRKHLINNIILQIQVKVF